MHGLYGYFARNLKGKKGQSGFTLIELLVVVTILGVLAAIVTLSLVGLTTNAQTKACLQEYRVVQSGLDAYMAYFNLNGVTAQGSAGPPVTGSTSDMTTLPDGIHPLYNAGGTPTFIRNSPTTFAYTWDAFGRITAISQAVNGPTKPTDCKPSGT
jgi:prepilin-type N-terminal cleavage/methylation domain-containing protein